MVAVALRRAGVLASCSWFLALAVASAFVAGFAGGAAAQEPAREQDKSVEGFGEARRGDVPEGTARDDDRRDRQGDQEGPWPGSLAARIPTGRSAAGTYRGNIAVTSLAGAGVHVIRLEPGTRSLRHADRQGVGLCDGQHVAIGLYCGVGVIDSWPDVFAWLWHVVPGRGLRHDASQRDPREASKGGSSDHRHAESRRRMAVSAGARVMRISR